MCHCGTFVVCFILFSVAIGLAIYYGVFHVDEDASKVIKETGSKIKDSIKDGFNKLSND